MDVVVSDRSAAAVAFIELKWAWEDSLWKCAWDILKAALVSRLQLAQRGMLLVGASEVELRTRYAGLLRPSEHEMAAFLWGYRDAIKPFCFREPAAEHPTGPYELPDRFTTTVLADYAFRLRAGSWTLTLLDVAAAPDAAWLPLDDSGRSAPTG